MDRLRNLLQPIIRAENFQQATPGELYREMFNQAQEMGMPLNQATGLLDNWSNIAPQIQEIFLNGVRDRINGAEVARDQQIRFYRNWFTFLAGTAATTVSLWATGKLRNFIETVGGNLWKGSNKLFSKFILGLASEKFEQAVANADGVAKVVTTLATAKDNKEIEKELKDVPKELSREEVLAKLRDIDKQVTVTINEAQKEVEKAESTPEGGYLNMRPAPFQYDDDLARQEREMIEVMKKMVSTMEQRNKWFSEPPQPKIAEMVNTEEKGGKKAKKKKSETPWVKHVKNIAKRENLTFFKAMPIAAKEWDKVKKQPIQKKKGGSAPTTIEPYLTAGQLKEEKAKLLSNVDLKKILNEEPNIVSYEDIPNHKTLDSLLGPKGYVIVLYQSEPNIGHWVTVLKRGNVIEFFDPYGGKLDSQLEWTPERERKALGQDFPHLSKLFLESPENYVLTYNHFPFQKLEEGVNTCGRWIALRLLFRDLSLEEFERIFKSKTKDSDDLATLMTSLKLNK